MTFFLFMSDCGQMITHAHEAVAGSIGKYARAKDMICIPGCSLAMLAALSTSTVREDFVTVFAMTTSSYF